MHIEHARLETLNRIVIQFSDAPGELQSGDIILAPALEIKAMESRGNEVVLSVASVDCSRSYSVLLRGAGIVPLDIEPCLSEIESTSTLGCTLDGDFYVFRLFAPRARSVQLHLFEHIDDDIGTVHFLEKRKDGSWELAVERQGTVQWYAYAIDGPRETGEMFNSRILVGDPYAQAVATRNTFRHSARCLLPDFLPAYDWEGDTHVTVPPEDLIVYEMHVRDMSAHPSSGAVEEEAGTYAVVAQADGAVIDHLRTLGVNAVELLPCQQYAWMEPPYMQHAGDRIYNDWNPYERNHWGYMTSFFFSPEPRYAVGADLTPGHWNAVAPAHVTQFKDMVKALHREGIAVILDVVYNHSSQYDYQPLKYIDKRYYYRTTEGGAFRDSSGCGNDLDSRRPMMRRLIVDSVLHWMEEYHVDGFRFDLASIIDRETFLEIRERARALHPGVILIAEPWGETYDPHGFSDIDYAAWNDVFRNGVKGHDPMKGRGYLFGSWGSSVPEDFGKWMLGSVREKGGPFVSHRHAVNYLESHDGYTLGDFIRIATGSARPGQVISEVDALLRLNTQQLRIARLGAVLLFAARGIVMLHAGQEFARSKIIAERGIHDVAARVLDHNSYEKDDETNWIDYGMREVNRDLFEYYRGLVQLRKQKDVLRRSKREHYHFLSPTTSLASGFILQAPDGHPHMAVLINANHVEWAEYELTGGRRWSILVNDAHAGTAVLGLHEGRRLKVPPISAMILETVA